MFLDIEHFTESVLSRHPSVSLVTWENRAAMVSFLKRIGPAIRKQDDATIVGRISVETLDAVTFSQKLLEAVAKQDARNRCLLIYDLEPMAITAGRLLNGFRERLAALRAVIVAVRENRRCDFVVAAPDLMDWIGLTIARAEDLAPPFTIKDVNAALKDFEERYGMKSKEFVEKWIGGAPLSIEDGWFWNELVAIRSELQARSTK